MVADTPSSLVAHSGTRPDNSQSGSGLSRSVTSGGLSFTQTNNYPRSRAPPLDEVPLALAPCILVLGGEGSGVSVPVQKRAEVIVTLPPAVQTNRDVGIDSLNVSVAAGLICWELLRGANATRQRIDSDTGKGSDRAKK